MRHPTILSLAFLTLLSVLNACGAETNPEGGNETTDSSGGTSPFPAATGGQVDPDSGSGGALLSATGGRADPAGVGSGPAGEGSAGGSFSGGSGGDSSPPSTGGLPPIDDTPPLPVRDLPRIEEMPDPLTMNDGSKVTTKEQWVLRRREMIKILEDYTYGHMPPPPEGLTAEALADPVTITSGSAAAQYQQIHLSFGTQGELGFDVGLFLPQTRDTVEVPQGGFPLLISLTYNSSESSLGGAAGAFSRGYAVATIGYQELGADAANYRSTAFFPAYPDYDWRDISAWAWGLSRSVDYLVTDTRFDPSKIMITGVSRLGQAVLLAGAFDERIALSAPVAGGMAFRFSGAEMGNGLGQGITEIVDQNTYWFGPLFEEFRNQTPRLPSDQHWLPALTAPRLFIMCNSLADPYGRAYAAAQSYLGAKPVYEFLDAPDHLGQHFRPGGHGATEEDWTAIFDFADLYLLGKAGERRFDVLPPDDQLP